MRVIIVSYYFPPLGLAGTARPLALANYFAAQGDEVHVVSVKPIAYPAFDVSMEAQLDKRVTVVRVGSTDPARIQRFLPIVPFKKLLGRSAKSASAATMFPDSKIGFVPGAVRAVKKLLQSGNGTLLITTSPPVSSHLVGLESAGYAKIQWVADFRDIWSSLPLPDSGDARKERADSLLRKIIGNATLITATSPKTAQTFAANYDQASKLLFLPNGFCESDFQVPAALDSTAIGLYGTLNDLVGFEKLAIWLGKSDQLQLHKNAKLSHVGYVDLPALNAILADTSLKDKFSSTGYLPHPEALSSIRRSVVNIVALSDLSDTSYIVPSKLWELLRAEPPLIALLPPGNAARDLLSERKFAGVWVVDSGEQLDEILKSVLDEPEKYRALRTTEVCREFEWQNLFLRLSAKLKELRG